MNLVQIYEERSYRIEYLYATKRSAAGSDKVVYQITVSERPEFIE